MYSWGEHVGELELLIEAASEREVFADAGRAFAELVSGDEASGAAGEWRSVRATGGDRALLLADFLDELVFLAEIDGFVPSGVDEIALADESLDARLRGHRGAPRHLVKAVTHHGLSFEPVPSGWRATALLDV